MLGAFPTSAFSYECWGYMLWSRSAIPPDLWVLRTWCTMSPNSKWPLASTLCSSAKAFSLTMLLSCWVAQLEVTFRIWVFTTHFHRGLFSFWHIVNFPVCCCSMPLRSAIGNNPDLQAAHSHLVWAVWAVGSDLVQAVLDCSRLHKSGQLGGFVFS
jgi:hypothetical protein